MSRNILVTSGKGGVGKTTVVVNLGYALAKLHKKVLLIDVDFGLNNLDVVMGIENKIVYDMFDVADGKCRVSQALIQDFEYTHLYILPTNRTFCVAPTGDRLKSIVKELEPDFDYILIDCPAGIDMGFDTACMLANEAIVVTTPHISSVRDADKALIKLDANGINLSGLVINRARGDLIVRGNMISINTIVQYLGITLYGVIPESDNISCQLLQGGYISDGGDACVAYDMLANRIAYGKSEIFDCTARYKGLAGSIRQKLRRYV